MIMLAKGYTETLNLIKEEITHARIRVVKKVESEQVNHYLSIGKIILEQQGLQNWGKSVVEQISKDLQKEFPNTDGYSARNLWDMRRFYARYSSNPKLRQLVAEIPWGHNLLILTKVKDDKIAEFYIKASSEYVRSHNHEPNH